MFCYGAIVFGSAALVAILSWTTEHFSKNFLLSLRSFWTYFYGVVVGAFGVGIYLAMDHLGLEIKLINPWAKALAVGLGTKAILSFDFLSWQVGFRKFPFGLKIILEALDLLLKEPVEYKIKSLNKKFVMDLIAGITDGHLALFKAHLIEAIEEESSSRKFESDKKDIIRRVKRAQTSKGAAFVFYKHCGPRGTKYHIVEFKKDNSIT